MRAVAEAGAWSSLRVKRRLRTSAMHRSTSAASVPAGALPPVCTTRTTRPSASIVARSSMRPVAVDRTFLNCGIIQPPLTLPCPEPSTADGVFSGLPLSLFLSEDTAEAFSCAVSDDLKACAMSRLASSRAIACSSWGVGSTGAVRSAASAVACCSCSAKAGCGVSSTGVSSAKSTYSSVSASSIIIAAGTGRGTAAGASRRQKASTAAIANTKATHTARAMLREEFTWR